MPLGWVAGAAIGGDIISGIVGGKEASTQAGVAGQAGSQSGTLFGEQQGFEGQLKTLMDNPSSVTSLPGYQFQFDQGMQALSRSDAAGGFAGSGNSAIAAEQYGQNYASSFLQQQESLLTQLSGITQNASAPLGTAVSANQSSANILGGSLATLGQGGTLAALAYGQGNNNYSALNTVANNGTYGAQNAFNPGQYDTSGIVP